MRSLKSVVWLLALALAGFAVPRDASAGSLRLRVEDITSGKGVVLSDASGTGLVTWAGFVGTVFTLSGGTSVTTAESTTIDLFGLTISTTGPAKLRLSLQDTSLQFGTPGRESTLIGMIGGTLALLNPISTSGTSGIEAQAWASPSNSVPNLGADTGWTATTLAPLGSNPSDAVAAFNPIFTSGPGAFSATGYANFVNAGPYSLFSTVTITLAGAGITSFDLMAMDPIPEPTTLLLVGSGLLGMAYRARRRRLAR